MNQIIDLRTAVAWEALRKWYKQNGYTAVVENMTELKREHNNPELLLWVCQNGGLPKWERTMFAVRMAG